MAQLAWYKIAPKATKDTYKLISDEYKAMDNWFLVPRTSLEAFFKSQGDGKIK